MTALLSVAYFPACLITLNFLGGFSATGVSPVMRYQDGGIYSVEIEIKNYQAASLPCYGGDSEGVGFGVCLGVNCPSELLTGIGGIGGVGILDVGCLMLFAGDGGGGCRMRGVFGG